jgi:hypothetical protein
MCIQEDRNRNVFCPSWKEYKIELRATPDTDDIEEQQIKQVSGPTSPQTVYITLYAHSQKEAEEHAIETESQFTHRRDRTLIVNVKGKVLHVPLRKDIWVFGTRLPGAQKYCSTCVSSVCAHCREEDIPYNEYNHFVQDLSKHLDSL